MNYESMYELRSSGDWNRIYRFGFGQFFLSRSIRLFQVHILLVKGKKTGLDILGYIFPWYWCTEIADTTLKTGFSMIGICLPKVSLPLKHFFSVANAFALQADFLEQQPI